MMAVTINDFGLTFWYHLGAVCSYGDLWVSLPWIDNLQTCMLI